MRISEGIAGAGLICLALAGCDSGAGRGPTSADGKAGVEGMADCAIGAQAGWTRNCAIERAGDFITFRHADGGFRRFKILTDGRGLESADGAEPADVAIIGKGAIEVSAGEDRYRLPAIIAGEVRR